MPLPEDLLIVAAILLVAAHGVSTLLRSPSAAMRVGTAALVALAGVVVALAAAAVAHRSWWDLLTSGIFAACAAVMWDLHWSACTGRPSRVLRRRMRRVFAQERGRPLRTLVQLRAEYAQSILDDASRDSVLTELLDEFAGVIAAEMAEPKGHPGIGDLEFLTAYANRYVDSLSQPGRRPQGPAYRGYSREMLTIAAVCRAAERLN
jgi:hypothetical protein